MAVNLTVYYLLQAMHLELWVLEICAILPSSQLTGTISSSGLSRRQ